MEFCNSDESILFDSDNKKQFLSDISPQDKPWDSHKAFNIEVASTLKGSIKSGHQKQGERLDDCSQNLEFGYVLESTETGKLKLRLKSARFCRVRHCPICQWRRALMWVARFFDVFPRIYAAHPEMRYIMLTLTVRNCAISELRSVVNRMSQAFQRLSQRKDFPALGFVRSLEVTRGKDGSCHPHFHVLLAVPPSYFSGGSRGSYLSKDKWSALWLESLHLDEKGLDASTIENSLEPLEDFALRVKNLTNKGYRVKEAIEFCVIESKQWERKKSKLRAKIQTNWARDWLALLLEQERILNASNPNRKKYEKNKYMPVCDVRIVKEKPKKEQIIEDLRLSESESTTPQPINALMSAITETIKYTTKPADMVKEKAWLLEMIDQMQNVRAIALGGIFKQFLKETESEQDLITPSEADLLEAKKNEGGFIFGWRSKLKRYVFTGKKEDNQHE